MSSCLSPLRKIISKEPKGLVTSSGEVELCGFTDRGIWPQRERFYACVTLCVSHRMKRRVGCFCLGVWVRGTLFYLTGQAVVRLQFQCWSLPFPFSYITFTMLVIWSAQFSNCKYVHSVGQSSPPAISKTFSIFLNWSSVSKIPHPPWAQPPAATALLPGSVSLPVPGAPRHSTDNVLFLEELISLSMMSLSPSTVSAHAWMSFLFKAG